MLTAPQIRSARTVEELCQLLEAAEKVGRGLGGCQVFLLGWVLGGEALGAGRDEPSSKLWE